jgi:hypothetical protein
VKAKDAKEVGRKTRDRCIKNYGNEIILEEIITN